MVNKSYGCKSCKNYVRNENYMLRGYCGKGYEVFYELMADLACDDFNHDLNAHRVVSNPIGKQASRVFGDNEKRNGRFKK